MGEAKRRRDALSRGLPDPGPSGTSRGEFVRSIRCGEHGSHPWECHVVCLDCGSFFTTHDPTLPTHAPPVCPCGAALMPSGPRDTTFRARAACAECFSRRRTRGTA